MCSLRVIFSLHPFYSTSSPAKQNAIGYAVGQQAHALARRLPSSTPRQKQPLGTDDHALSDFIHKNAVKRDSRAGVVCPRDVKFDGLKVMHAEFISSTILHIKLQKDYHVFVEHMNNIFIICWL